MKDNHSDDLKAHSMPLSYASEEKHSELPSNRWGIMSVVITMAATPNILRCFGFFDVPDVVSSTSFKLSMVGSMISVALSIAGLACDRSNGWSIVSLFVNVFLLLVGFVAWNICY